MTTSGKKIRIAQPVKRVTIDAGLLPTAKSGAGAASGEAKVNIVAPIAPKAVALRQTLKQQSISSAVARVDAAIEAGAVSAAEAKALVLALASKRIGSAEGAEKWYRSHHIADFGGRTPAQMVRAGELKTLVAHMRAAEAQPKG